MNTYFDREKLKEISDTLHEMAARLLQGSKKPELDDATRGNLIKQYKAISFAVHALDFDISMLQEIEMADDLSFQMP